MCVVVGGVWELGGGGDPTKIGGGGIMFIYTWKISPINLFYLISIPGWLHPLFSVMQFHHLNPVNFYEWYNLHKETESFCTSCKTIANTSWLGPLCNEMQFHHFYKLHDSYELISPFFNEMQFHHSYKSCNLNLSLEMALIYVKSRRGSFMTWNVRVVQVTHLNLNFHVFPAWMLLQISCTPARLPCLQFIYCYFVLFLWELQC